MPIQLTQQEVNGFNIIAAEANRAQQALNNALAAQRAFIGLLEKKYAARYDEKTGQLAEIKPEPEE